MPQQFQIHLQGVSLMLLQIQKETQIPTHATIRVVDIWSGAGPGWAWQVCNYTLYYYGSGSMDSPHSSVTHGRRLSGLFTLQLVQLPMTLIAVVVAVAVDGFWA